MIVYTSTKKEFIREVNDFPIEQVILKKFEEKLHRTTGKSEIESWRDSLPYMSQVLSDNEIPDDAGILIEYMIPQSSFRVDFIITGINNDGKDNVVIVELKRWSDIDITDKDGIVKTRFKGGVQETSHPSYQSWSYAAFLNSFNETIYTDDITLRPCAYLHNYVDDGKITNANYQHYIDLAPLFLQSDKIKLRDFIKKYVKKGDTSNIMYRIENGKIKPSKALADSLVSMMKGNQEFIMLDDQKIVFESAMSGAKKSTEKIKNVLIVEGGPGTGKSVVAINLLVGINKMGKVAKYITKNSAPRAVYKAMLTGNLKGGDIDFLFTGSGSFTDTTANMFDALIVDEAHRLNAKSGMFSHLGENQVKEIINSSKFSVFFIDEEQKVTTKDIGSKEEILKWAKVFNANVHLLELRSQFRCNGSNGYLAWLDNTLQIKDTANVILEKTDYNFIVVDSPSEMRDKIYELNEINNKSRMLAGYCWEWISKKDKSKKDINFPQFDFSHKWNLASDGMQWIISKDSVSEIGCIHTSQGLELENVGVIVGKDLIVRDGVVITNFKERASTDKSLSGIVGLHKKDPTKALEIADKIIKNTYRTLLTRGMKSCYVYFEDQETNEYFKSRINLE
jgi:DUF2075 family protein